MVDPWVFVGVLVIGVVIGGVYSAWRSSRQNK